MLQHARFDVPNRAHGYCLDDAARALIVAVDAAAAAETPDHVRLVQTYLGYIADAQLRNGEFHNFMGYDRCWQDHRAGEDAVGRAVWGLGVCERRAPRASWRALAAQLRAAALPHVARFTYLRPRAYAILGLVASFDAEPDDRDAVRAAIADAAAPIADGLAQAAGDGWTWCESEMTYDNARLPEALLRAGRALDERAWIDAGLAMLAFLDDATNERGVFAPVGNAGWWRRGGVKARFGQQPLEAAAMIDAALVAHALTAAPRWRDAAERAFAWYEGRNVLGAPLVRDGGCCDGLDAGGPNPNMGAESTIAYLSAAAAMAVDAREPLEIGR